MTAARTPPEVPPLGAPVSFLVDYDGTISLADIGDALLARYFPDPIVAAKDADYDAGRVGSRQLMRWDMDVLPRDEDLLRGAAAEMPQDPAFTAFVQAARGRGAAVEVVSDGLGFYVADNLARLGLADLPLATNENRVAAGGRGMGFPYGHPRCFVCGTCKRERVRVHQALGRAVVFIGDGTSDRYAAYHADVVLAKGPLASFCTSAGWQHVVWTDFAELTAWLSAAWRDGDLPTDRAELATWRSAHPSMAARAALPADRPGVRPPESFICGPEVWGPGRETPLIPAG